MTTLLLVRHGYSEANKKRIFAGSTDAELTALGLEQAEKTAKYIAANYAADKIYSSDLKRALKTAERIAAHTRLEIEKDPRVREIYGGKWEGMTFSEIDEKYPEDFDVWKKDIGNCVCTGGESVRQCGKRVFDGVKAIAAANEGKTVVICTHGMALRTLCCIVKGISFDSLDEVPLAVNASVTKISYADGKLTLDEYGESEHLENLERTCV